VILAQELVESGLRSFPQGTAWDYPREARQRGWEGATKIRVKFEADGLLMDVVISRSSGFSALDESALSVFRSSRPPEGEGIETGVVPQQPAPDAGRVLPGPSLK